MTRPGVQRCTEWVKVCRQVGILTENIEERDFHPGRNSSQKDQAWPFD